MAKMAKTLKVSDETYERLNQIAGRLRAQEGEPVSLDETIRRLLNESQTTSIQDYRGAWTMTDDEQENFERALKEAWSRWDPGS